ncbi:hypothetical protein LZ198_08795 [Myxococcus sp. K15C18031901]|uniref:LVIVD repeat-containing protein n=1 Tax=Myxococcus dinghuensis TaxID=2906761 RepID=UPI0020A7421B|nr:hypothetical protein [Myxococcus dinghuensis]MCP3098973.1 hypothetical protein [Myxococcus dinghuensis]
MPSLSSPRSSWVAFVAWGLLLSTAPGCRDSPQSTSDAGVPVDSGTPDAGDPDAGTPPWDGTYTVLEERGDGTGDPGVLSRCALLPQMGESPAGGCFDPSIFDMSACDSSTLANIQKDGIYQVRLREEHALEDGGVEGSYYTVTMGLRSDGGPSTFYYRPITVDERGSDSFLVGHTIPVRDGGVTFTLAGCEAPSNRYFTGCFVRCTNGKVTERATADAHRMVWGEGEQESSGGLELVSETYVAQGTPVDIYVAKNHAYVVSALTYLRPGKAGGLSIYDVTDRRHPVLRKVISLPDDQLWNSVWTKGDALYVASQDTGIVVYDITNPADPQLVRRVPSSAPLAVHTVLVDGDRLYGMGLWPANNTLVFDVSKPLEPQLLQRLSFPLVDTYDAPHDAFAYQGRLYISHQKSGLHVVDVENPNDMKLLGTYAYPNATAHHNAVGTFAGRTIAFEGGENHGAHLRVLDVTDPAHIVKIGAFQLRPTVSIHNILLVGTRLYITWYQEGVRVLDVANPTKPRQVAHFNTHRETDPERTDDAFEGAIGIRVPGDGYVYVVDTSRGLLILNELPRDTQAGASSRQPR